MDEQWLGDSYDLVKRFWKKSLEPVAPLYAHPRFVPSTIRTHYTAVTTIPILDTRPHGRVGVLIDPDTGIPLPDSTATRATTKYASLLFIIVGVEKLASKTRFPSGEFLPIRVFLLVSGCLRACHRWLRSHVEEPHQSFQVLCHSS